MTARVLYAGLQLLDRQLVDHEGRLCGKVDDLELTDPGDDPRGRLYVAAVLSGPGALLQRTGHTRLGGWLRRHVAEVLPGGGTDPVAIPVARVADIGDHVTLSLDSEQVATYGGERWIRDHVIRHIPGAAAMRIGELLQSRVVDVDGHDMGSVNDVRLVQDGPYIEGFGAALRVDALVVGAGSIAVRLGYHRHRVKGPALLKAIFGAIDRRAHYIPWNDVADWDGSTVTLRLGHRDVDRLRDRE